MTDSLQQQRSRVAGFTLLEALIATAMMAMILVALSTITAQWLPNWNRGMTRVQRDEDLALGLDRLTADLEAAQFVPTSRETRKPFFSGTSRSVTFVRTNLSPNAHAGLDFVRFAEVGSTNGPSMVRTEAPFKLVVDDLNKGEQPHFSDPIALVRAPYRITLSYAGADRVWRDTWQQETFLPSAVRLTVRDAQSGRPIAASTAALLHIAIPAECIRANSFAECLTSLESPSGAGPAQPRGPSPGQNP